MPLRIKEFVIQAKFEEELKNKHTTKAKQDTVTDTALLKDEIINVCMEKLEDYLRKREGR